MLYRNGFIRVLSNVFYVLQIISAFLFISFGMMVLEEVAAVKRLLRHSRGSGFDYRKVVLSRVALLVLVTLPGFFQINEYHLMLATSAFTVSILNTFLPVTANPPDSAVSHSLFRRFEKGSRQARGLFADACVECRFLFADDQVLVQAKDN